MPLTREAHFCPQCGSPLHLETRYGRERPVCAACGHTVFFDPKVAVVAFVVDDDRVLMVRRAHDPGKGGWALPAGFVEYDEDPARAAERETLEETGLIVRTDRLIDLLHRPDALAAADDCIYLKRIAELAAPRFGLKSTCMAKPYADQAGSGLHVHCSVIDKNGKNILDAKGGDPVKLKSICAGMLQTMRDAQLIFAPFANSYRRFQPGSFAPVDLTWGFGHRGTAIRIPDKDGQAARVEHRVRARTSIPTCF